MIKLCNNPQTGLRIFIITFLAAVFTQYYPDVKILVSIVIVFSIIYLTLGWYIFRGYFREGSHPLVFLMGYLYSGVFISSVFGAKGWPLSITMVGFSPVWAVSQLIFVFIIRKKLPRESFIHFLFEGGLLVILSLFLIERL
jgi:hypothetical protein